MDKLVNSSTASFTTYFLAGLTEGDFGMQLQS